MKRNKQLLLKTAKRIEDNPRSYDQTVFYRPNRHAPCGTVGCLAGEIIIASERSIAKGVAKLESVMHLWNTSGSHQWPGDVAARLAGLTKPEGLALFPTMDARTWPYPFASQFRLNKAKAAAALLRYLANGGKV